MPEERLRWHVLRSFQALPSEPRVRAMKARDYLWCLLHMQRDDEEALERLCPHCRARAERDACPACGADVLPRQFAENESFDMARFEALREGGAPT